MKPHAVELYLSRTLASVLLLFSFWIATNSAFGQQKSAANIQIDDPIAINPQAESRLVQLQEALTRSDGISRVAIETLLKSKSSPLIQVSSIVVDDQFGVKTFSSERSLTVDWLIRHPEFATSDPVIDSIDSLESKIKHFQSIISQVAIQTNARSLLLQLVDALIDEGWTSSARSLIYRIDPTILADLGSNRLNSISVRNFAGPLQLSQSNAWVQPLVLNNQLSLRDRSRLTATAQLLMRLLYCSYLDHDRNRIETEIRFILDHFGELPYLPKSNLIQIDLDSQESNIQIKDQVAKWQDSFNRTMSDNSAFDDLLTPIDIRNFTSRIFDHTLTSEQDTDPSRIKIIGYPYRPEAITNIQNDAIFFFRSDRKLAAWSESSGKFWPIADRADVLDLPNDDRATNMVADDIRLLGGLAPNDEHLFFLVDSQRRSSSASHALQKSLLVGIDLKKEAAILSQTPLAFESAVKAKASEFSFVGTPLLADSVVYILARDRRKMNVFKLVCLTVPSQQLFWQSPEFGSAEIADDWQQDSSAMLLHEGQITVATGNGTLATFDTDDGTITYQVNYARRPTKNNRFSAVALMPSFTKLMRHQELLICKPCDCERMFAVNWSNGQFQWATSAEVMDRSSQLLSQIDGRLWCIGERVQSFDVESGTVLTSAELPRTAQSIAGRASVVGNSLLWSSGPSIFQIDMNSLVAQDTNYRLINFDQIMRWPIEIGGPIAFRCEGRSLAVVTPEKIQIFQHAPITKRNQ